MTLFDIVYAFLKFDDWDFEFDEVNEIFRIEIMGNNSQFETFLTIDETGNNIVCNTYSYDLPIPKVNRLTIYEFLNRLNFDQNSGNFEINVENQKIRYRVSLNLENAKPSRKQLLYLIWSGVQIFDEFYPELQTLLKA